MSCFLACVSSPTEEVRSDQILLENKTTEKTEWVTTADSEKTLHASEKVITRAPIFFKFPKTSITPEVFINSTTADTSVNSTLVSERTPGSEDVSVNLSSKFSTSVDLAASEHHSTSAVCYVEDSSVKINSSIPDYVTTIIMSTSEREEQSTLSAKLVQDIVASTTVKGGKNRSENDEEAVEAAPVTLVTVTKSESSTPLDEGLLQTDDLSITTDSSDILTEIVHQPSRHCFISKSVKIIM